MRVLVLLTPWERVKGVLMVWWGGVEPPTPATQGGDEVLDEPKERAGSGKEPKTRVE